MVDKKYFFMAGLPRSGGTLLSAILNQNPDIYVSPQSPLLNILGSAYNQYQSKENKDNDMSYDIYNVLDGIIPLFYESRKEKYIIDRNFSWLDGHPYAILEKHLKNDIKVICPVRDMLEILASWNRLCENDKDNRYDKEILEQDKTDRKMADKRADRFMNFIGSVGDINVKSTAIENLKRVLYPEFKDNILLVEYDDIVGSPIETVNKVYDFLGIDRYSHDLSNIKSDGNYTDAWGIKGHHKLKSELVKEEYDLTSIFSSDTIARYSGMEFWKDMK